MDRCDICEKEFDDILAIEAEAAALDVELCEALQRVYGSLYRPGDEKKVRAALAAAYSEADDE